MFLPIWEVFLLGALLVPLGWILLFLVFGHVVCCVEGDGDDVDLLEERRMKKFSEVRGNRGSRREEMEEQGSTQFFVGNKGILFVVRGVRQKIMGCNEEKKCSQVSIYGFFECRVGV